MDTWYRPWARRCDNTSSTFPCTDLEFYVQIFVRAFDLDERLVGVAFMDVGLYVTSLKTIKNLLLIGDAVKSISFVAFQVINVRPLVSLKR
jgi:hypothetical protein